MIISKRPQSYYRSFKNLSQSDFLLLNNYEIINSNYEIINSNSQNISRNNNYYFMLLFVLNLYIP
jgi:hypothetical protein